MKKINTLQPPKLLPSQKRKKAREYAREYARRKREEKKQQEEPLGEWVAPAKDHDLVDSIYEAARTLKMATKDGVIKKELNRILAFIISENQ